jgi:Protein of unknown function (DUF2797)
MPHVSAYVRKLESELVEQQVHYYFATGAERIFLNEAVGYPLTLHFLNEAACVACGRKIKKTFQQGYCFPCTQNKAQCDLCILKPELCHFAQGTCREPEWGEAHCMTQHFVYLANASAIKVGITRYSNIPTRFIDQGAVQALPIFKVNTRHDAGLIEVELAKQVADKTNWRKMLAPATYLDLLAERQKLAEPLLRILENKKDIAIEVLNLEPLRLDYPIKAYPKSIKSVDFLTQGSWQAPLLGIKGQYLLFENGVLNLRNLSGYALELTF